MLSGFKDIIFLFSAFLVVVFLFCIFLIVLGVMLYLFFILARKIMLTLDKIFDKGIKND